MRRLALIVLFVTAWVAGTSVPSARGATPDLRQGAALFYQGRHREAEAVFTAVAKTRPRDAQAWVWLGVTWYARGDDTRAASAFEYAVQLQPRNAQALLWWGHALARSGRLQAAQTAFQRVLLAAAPPKVHEMAMQALRVVRPAPTLAARGPAAPAWVNAVESYEALARHYNPALPPEQARRIAWALLEYSREFNLDPRLVVALVVVESGFQPRVRSRAGAIGLGQLMPETARALGVDPDDPVQNLYGAIRHLRDHLDRFGWHNVHLALAAYNAGRAAVERYEGIPPYDETRWYVFNVTNLYTRLRAI
ncbi:MAG: transglycosylase SLT domain-containing protein [Armatimonadetes bacterium]|nr:transglycosylase SLT domain-containing protein [Armatimonadota bacterium]